MLLITDHNRFVGAHCCKVGNNSKTTALSTTNPLPSRLASGCELHHFGLLIHLAKDSKICPCVLNCYSQPCLQLFKTLSIYTMDHNDFIQGIASCGRAEISSAKTAIDFTGERARTPQTSYFSESRRC